MRDRYNRWVIPFFLLAWLAPRGEVGRVEQKMKGEGGGGCGVAAGGSR